MPFHNLNFYINILCSGTMQLNFEPVLHWWRNANSYISISDIALKQAIPNSRVAHIPSHFFPRLYIQKFHRTPDQL